MTRIKICGIKEEEHALAATEAGADFIGLVFAASRRQVTLSQAERVADVVKKSNHITEIVGVFVNMPFAEVNHTADICHLDRVQLSGDESWDYCLEIERPIIKVIHIVAGRSSGEVITEIGEGYRFLKSETVFLLDSRLGDAYGGTGRTFDWELAGEVAGRFPVIVAGGLALDNIGRLVREIKPWGVDVSTGVETGGRKDIAKIRAFIGAVRSAERYV